MAIILLANSDAKDSYIALRIWELKNKGIIAEISWSGACSKNISALNSLPSLLFPTFSFSTTMFPSFDESLKISSNSFSIPVGSIGSIDLIYGSQDTNDWKLV